MYRHMGHHFVKKYNHTLVVNTVYDDLKPSRVLTSASSRPHRDRSVKLNPEQAKKRNRTYLFSPQISLKRYKSRATAQSLQNSTRSSSKQVKLIISTMVENVKTARATQTPTKQVHKEVHFCTHCQSRQKSKQASYLKLLGHKQNVNISNLLSNQWSNKPSAQLPKLELDNKIVIMAHRISPRRPSPKASQKPPCIHTSSEFKPWDMAISESSI